MQHIHGGDIYTTPGMIDYSANLNPLGMPVAAIAAAATAIAQPACYPDPRCRELRQALAAAKEVNPDHIVFGNGAADLIFRLPIALRPAAALLPAPTFYEYTQALRTVGCTVYRHLLQAGQGFRLDESILDSITPATDIVFICSPNNPTGTLTPRSLLHRILQKCAENDALLVVDECFLDFVDQPEQFTMRPLLQRPEGQHLFILGAFTKIYAMAGLRLGYGLCANRELIGRIEACGQPWSVSTPAQAAGVAALGDTEYLSRTRRLIADERTFLADGLTALGFTVYPPAANYIFFTGPPALVDACRAHGYMIRDCRNYDNLQPGCFRIAVRTHSENAAFLAMLQTAAAEL